MVLNLVLIAGAAALTVLLFNSLANLFDGSSGDSTIGFSLIPLLAFAPFFFGGVAILAIATRSRVAGAVASSLIPTAVAVFIIRSLLSNPLEPILWLLLLYPAIFLSVVAGTVNEDMHSEPDTTSTAFPGPPPPLQDR